MRIVFVGGGSGGHFFPLIAIAEAVRASEQGRGAELYYMGPHPYDAEALRQLGIEFVSCPSGKMRRYAAVANVLDSFSIAAGILVAIVKLFKIYPDVVMSKGGYTSVPVVLAAAFLRIPIVIHESDARPGRANLLAARFARFIAISYPDAKAGFAHKEDRIALTGIPIRKSILDARASPGTASELPVGARPIIAVFGGSSGAERINTLILSGLKEMLVRFDVVHQTGKENEASVREMAHDMVHDAPLEGHYRAAGFFEASEMRRVLGEASVIVSRAGSNTIAEIALSGKPAILIPIPEDISHDQMKNAYAYAREGGATVMEEKNLAPHLLIAEIDRILESETVRATMRAGAAHFVYPQAADTLARALLEIGNEHGS